jgi:hypothetical protein
MLHSAFPDEEALDWTAFQMAISGTMCEMYDIEWDANEDEVDDILRWWEGYGFRGMEGILPAETPIESPVKERKVIWRKSVPRRKPLPLLLNKMDLTGSEKISVAEGDPGTDLLAVPELEGNTPRKKKVSKSDESLPPSPMFDFGSADRDREELIPMGFNLGHDLGDFLDWEAKYVQQYVDN